METISVEHSTSKQDKLDKPQINCVVLESDMTEELQKEIIELAKEAWEKFPIKKFVYKPEEEEALAPELGASFEVSTQTAREQKTNQYTHMAQYIKTEIDKKLRPCWHVIVGTEFGCFMSHDSGTFIYLDMGDYRPCILMFKSGTLDQPLY